MRAHRSQTVGVVVPNVSNAFTAEMMIGLEGVLAEAGVVTLMANSFEDVDRQDLLVRSLVELNVDALLVVPATSSRSAFTRWLAALSIPAVLATRKLPHPDLSFVGVDNRSGGRLAAEHLVGTHGCRSIGYIGGHDLRTRKDRVRGIREVMTKARGGDTLAVDVCGSPDGAMGLAAVTELVDAGRVPEALVCHTDAVAFGVYRGLRDLAPDRLEDVHVVSYDDVAEAALWEPPVTSIAANGRDVGEQGARSLLRHIAHPKGEVEKVQITPELIIRRSCGCSDETGAARARG